MSLNIFRLYLFFDSVDDDYMIKIINYTRGFKVVDYSDVMCFPLRPV